MYVLFRAHAPLVSWGGPTTSSVSARPVRRVYRHPTKSALTGLLGSAMHGDCSNSTLMQELSSDLRVASLTVRYGKILRDYQTVFCPPRSHYDDGNTAFRAQMLSSEKVVNKPTDREYIQDGVWVCVLESISGSHETYLESLRSPASTLFLGRKCNTPGPMFPYLSESPTILGALREYFGWIPRKFLRRDRDMELVWTKGMKSGVMGHSRFSYCVDEPLGLRGFARRPIYRSYIPKKLVAKSGL